MSRIILVTLRIDSTSSNDVYSGDLLQSAILGNDDYEFINNITTKKRKWLSENNIPVQISEQIDYALFRKTINYYIDIEGELATLYHLKF